MYAIIQYKYRPAAFLKTCCLNAENMLDLYQPQTRSNLKPYCTKLRHQNASFDASFDASAASKRLKTFLIFHPTMVKTQPVGIGGLERSRRILGWQIQLIKVFWTCFNPLNHGPQIIKNNTSH